MSTFLGFIVLVVLLYIAAKLLVGFLKLFLIFVICIRHCRTSAWAAVKSIDFRLRTVELPDEDTRKILIKALNFEMIRLFVRWSRVKLPENLDEAVDTILCRMHASLKEVYLKPGIPYRVKYDCAQATNWLEKQSSASPWTE